MKICVLILISTFLLTQKTFCQNPLLKNGTYLVNSNFEESQNYKMTIADSSFVKYFHNDSITGNIVWENDILFFKYDIDEAEYSDLARLLHKSFGDYCMDLIRLKRKKYEYRIRQVDSLHITIDEGTITRTKK